jgi:ketosteroid isomerase-like protein
VPLLESAHSTDRFAILELAHRYTDAVNRHDAAAVARCFGDGGTWAVLAPVNIEYRGSATIADELERRFAGRDLIVQLVTGVVVTAVTGDTASARATVQETVRAADGSDGFRMIGIYDDRLAREDGGWLYASRTLRPVYFEPGVPAGRAFPPT